MKFTTNPELVNAFETARQTKARVRNEETNHYSTPEERRTAEQKAHDSVSIYIGAKGRPYVAYKNTDSSLEGGFYSTKISDPNLPSAEKKSMIPGRFIGASFKSMFDRDSQVLDMSSPNRHGSDVIEIAKHTLSGTKAFTGEASEEFEFGKPEKAAPTDRLFITNSERRYNDFDEMDFAPSVELGTSAQKVKQCQVVHNGQLYNVNVLPKNKPETDLSK